MKKRVQSVLFSVLVGALLLCARGAKTTEIYTAPDAANQETSTRRAFIRLPLKVIPVRLP